jgi:GT2 family glycosyltransferase
MTPDVTISIISADNLKLLMPCLRSVFGSTHRTSLEIFVVDNASATEPLAETVKAVYPQVTVIRNEARRGFSTNNNLALQRGNGRYLMILNDDTVVKDGALDHMIEFMDKHPTAGAIGSYLLNPDGSFQAAFARFPNPFLEAIWPATNWSRGAPLNAAPYEVDSVCGAAMLVRRAASNQVGLLDPNFDPIYSEEVDWCYRIKQGGWKIYTLPRAQIVHYGSVTMNRAVPHKYELLLSHKVLYFRKNNGRAAAFIYRVTLFCATALKVIAWGVWNTLRPSQAAQEKRDLHAYILRRWGTLSTTTTS